MTTFLEMVHELICLCDHWGGTGVCVCMPIIVCIADTSGPFTMRTLLWMENFTDASMSVCVYVFVCVCVHIYLCLHVHIRPDHWE